jgi:hypothetical protein
MSFTHKCKKCGLEVTYESADELKEHFYFKSGYYRKVCKACERKEHSEKFASGQYNYYKKKSGSYNKEYSFGIEGES